MYVDVSVASYSGKDTKTFCYECDKTLAADLKIGQLVSLNFARKPAIGIIRKLNAKKPAGIKRFEELKAVLPLATLPNYLLELSDWMIDYYACPAGSVWQLMLPKNPTTKPRKIFASNSQKTIKPFKLSGHQQKALNAILKDPRPSLLAGVMGSGKTEIYFNLISILLKAGKSSLLLMPEIFLTSQMVVRAKKHFGDQLLVTHSVLTSAERRAFWDDCAKLSAQKGIVVIGPRSALFSPIQNLGQIIIDECHEQSYKQDANPRYLTEHVAARLSQLSGSGLLLGSATPSVTTRYLSEIGKINLVSLRERAIKSQHPSIELNDISKTRSPFSKKLRELIEDSLAKHQSVMLYVNRRGTTPLFMCSDCGHNFTCPICSLNLHLHADIMRLNCHACGYTKTPPAECPNCQSTNLRGIGIGTKAIESLIKQEFPKSRLVRIDRDSARQNKSENYEKLLQSGGVDFIVGTQMLGRGIDIEGLNLVGILNADYDLLKNDYNSRERAYQQLSQTAGRAGRRAQRGKVIIQTRLKDDEVLKHVIENDYEAFYKDELAARKKYSYPPFCYLVKLECGFKSEELGKSKCESLAASLTKQKNLTVLGPSKCYPFYKKGKHYWKIIIKSPSRKRLVEIAKQLDSNWTINLDPFGIT